MQFSPKVAELFRASLADLTLRIAIFQRQRSRILQRADCIGKVHAMLGEIGYALGLVKLA